MPGFFLVVWWVMTGSNCRPSRCKRDALPTELITHDFKKMTFYQGKNYIGSFQTEPTFISTVREKFPSITIQR